MLRGLPSYSGEQRIAKVHNGQDRGAARDFQLVLISPSFVARIDQCLRRGPFDHLFRILEVSHSTLYYSGLRDS
jgi:hypothetical protein